MLYETRLETLEKFLEDNYPEVLAEFEDEHRTTDSGLHYMDYEEV